MHTGWDTENELCDDVISVLTRLLAPAESLGAAVSTEFQGRRGKSNKKAKHGVPS